MSIFDSLNEPQRKGVFTTEGPVLLLAGAGSGKTRVLTARIAWLIEEKGVNPWNIMAITFTNKAAGEMKERVEDMVGFGADSIWVATFHSTCVRILKRFADRLGYSNSFTIYDTDDQKTVIKEIMKKHEIDPKDFKDRYFLSAISNAKNELISPLNYHKSVKHDYHKVRIAKVYEDYQRTLKRNNAMDFDDLIMKTVELFDAHPDVLSQYQERFRYIMVDEYQDTNTAQFAFISRLAGKYRNICVVGDDDQSIYKFRGANIRNILDFEKVYSDAVVIKLEQNYRSTQNVLSAANAVISNNRSRKEKALWTDKGEGNKIHFRQFDNALEEADFITEDIFKKQKEKTVRYNDCAVLFRTNAQARLVEERFILRGIPYDVVGGTNFYARREIKDILAYLKTIDNGLDDIAIRRIINVPKRGIGMTSIQRVVDYADERNISFYDAMCEANQIIGLGKAAAKITAFTGMIQVFKSKLRLYGIPDLIRDIIDTTDYIVGLDVSSDEDLKNRIENIDELYNKAIMFEEANNEATLSDFLDEVALVADIDHVTGEGGQVLLMTLHSAKGLEFPHVYIAGMEDGIFPSYMSISAEDPESEIEEERRLAYVGITRAGDDLTLTCAKQRMVHGETQYNAVSRFLKEIPSELMDNRISSFRKMKISVPVKKYTAPENKPYVAGGTSALKRGGIGQGIPSMGASPDYSIGDRVTHIKYGIGTVKNLEQGAKDYQVSVDFDTAGPKVMYATFAKLKKV